MAGAGVLAATWSPMRRPPAPVDRARTQEVVGMPTLETMLDALADRLAADGEGCCPLCDGRMAPVPGRRGGILGCDGCGAELEPAFAGMAGRRAA